MRRSFAVSPAAPAIVAGMLSACVTSGPPNLLPALEPARDALQSAPGQWNANNGALENIIPAGVSAEALASGQVGAVLGLVPELLLEDCAIEAVMTFEGSGAPGVVFRARQIDAGSVDAMYVALLSRLGVALWRFDERQWQPLGRHAVLMTPGVPYRLRVETAGARVRVSVNGRRVLEGIHTSGAGVGAVGVMLREGPCRVESFRVVWPRLSKETFAVHGDVRKENDE